MNKNEKISYPLKLMLQQSLNGWSIFLHYINKNTETLLKDTDVRDSN